MRFEVEFNGHLVIREDDDTERVPSMEELEDIVGRVADELAKIDAQDAALDTDATDGGVQISVSVQAPDAAEAVHVGNGFIRGAVHGVGIHTPGWTLEWMKVHADRAEDGDKPKKEHLVSS